jgi:hypothetical protein
MVVRCTNPSSEASLIQYYYQVYCTTELSHCLPHCFRVIPVSRPYKTTYSSMHAQLQASSLILIVPGIITDKCPCSWRRRAWPTFWQCTISFRYFGAHLLNGVRFLCFSLSATLGQPPLQHNRSKQAIVCSSRHTAVCLSSVCFEGTTWQSAAWQLSGGCCCAVEEVGQRYPASA